ncbi:MAG: protein kinase [Planctomycetota bacterium]
MRFAHFEFDPDTDRLGEGPLSEVYRAVDTKLGRTVALKILRSHAELDPQADTRFEREAQHTSRLEHPNITTIYEYDRFNGTSYIAMEYVQGRTLDKIVKDQTLGFEECLRIAQQLTEALRKVHESGIIHRDLKPANILLQDDGNLKLLDFGIARARDESSITQHGMLVGTVLYMSPEQVRGDDLDARSDIFSLGAVLYHVTTGRLPYPGESFPEVCMAILDGPPKQRPSDVRQGFPKPLEEFILHCLSGAPEDRFADAGAAQRELHGVEGKLSGTGTRRPIELTGRLLVEAVGCGGPEPSTCSIMAGGLRKDLMAALKRNKGLVVDEEREPDAEYDYVLKSSLEVRQHKGLFDLELHVGERIVSERCTAEDEDEWTLQESLVSAALRVLRPHLSGTKVAARGPARQTREALALVARARDVLHRGRSRQALVAISLLRKALDEYDRFCPAAYAVLGEAMVRKFLYWDGDPTFLDEARGHADRALALDANCALAHTALGFASHLAGAIEEAQRAYRRAMQLDTEEWYAHRLLGAIYAREGNFKSATGLFQRAIGLRPSHIGSYDHLYSVLLRLDRYEEALEVADSGIQAARQRLHEVRDDLDARLHMAMLYARIAREDDARKQVRAAQELAPKDCFTAYHSACVHALLAGPEDLSQAVELLGHARDRGYYLRSELARNSDLDPLRGLPEFKALLDG